MATAILRELPAASRGGAAALAERVRAAAAVPAPMADFDRLIIAALGNDSGGVPRLGAEEAGDDEPMLETRKGARSLAPLLPVADDFSDQIWTLMRAAPPALDEDDPFGEEATTRAQPFDGVRVRAGDSISEVVCTNPVAVVEDAPSSLPQAMAALPQLLTPAPPSLLQRWRAVATVAAALLAIVVALAIGHARQPPRATAGAPAATIASASPVVTAANGAAPRHGPAHAASRHGTHASKSASRSAR
jgi:hypothetical protein